MTVAAEHGCAPYHSDEYAYPQAGEDDSIQRLGGLFSPYTNEVFDSKGDTDIEHVVARSEAHDSGLCRADAATKRTFSRDLLNLTTVPTGKARVKIPVLVRIYSSPCR